jgi:ABC-type amino acid transport substrate-binding protein
VLRRVSDHTEAKDADRRRAADAGPTFTALGPWVIAMAFLASRRAFLLSGAALALPLQASPVLRVAVLDVAPFGQETPDGGVSGLLCDRLQALSAQTGIELRPVLLPYRRASRAVATGEADLTASLPNPWIPPDALTLGRLMHLRIAAWPRAGLRLTQVADLQGLRVASLRGLRHEIAPVQVHAREEMLVRHPEQLRSLVMADRVDVAVGVVETLEHVARRSGCTATPASHGLRLGRQALQLFARPELAPHLADRLREVLV